ncbi:MAG TPA: recombination regulator RecX [Burkholderiales bacterium]|nr:recombination regulator RecX [Burkholderiales bacterium]
MATVPTLRARALKALGRREHSRQELQAKLQPFAENPNELDTLLDDLEKRGWLSEARFVDQVTTTRRRKFGAARIVHELRKKGVSDDAIFAAQAQLKAGEVEAARAVWTKKFGKLPRSLQERGKQARFLASRGFSAEVVRQVLKDGSEQE